jgi:nucleoporin NUP159
MSWNFSNVGNAADAGPQVNALADAQEIFQDALGFKDIGGESKVRLSQAWPEDKQPPAWASLLSIASGKGLIAAGTSEAVILVSSDTVRKTYWEVDSEKKPKTITPQLSLSVPQVSHVAFSADESSLVIAAQEGGGLAVYDVQSLLQGNKDSAFQLATNGISVRALAPNPSPDNAHLFAIVLTDGKLMLADLKQRSLINANNPVFREGVKCVSWSVKGKQLIAGLEDGSAEQYDPQGNLKAQLPRPPQLEQPTPMSSIVWIANDDFLVIHTPNSDDEAADSSYHMLHREKSTGAFTSQKLSGDPALPDLNSKRFPSHFLVSRLRKFPPNLEDMLILCSSAGNEAGVITSSSHPLVADAPANTYTVASFERDSARATFPMSIMDGMSDTSPVGMDLDLSSTDKVMQPIPGDDLESSGPLPALMVLNNEGLLSTWWIVYKDAVRQSLPYPGLTSVAPTQAQPATPATPATPAATGFAAFGKSSFGQAPKPAFGQASTPAFGQSSTPAFGQASTPAFGKPSAPAFGQASTPTFGQAATPAFGKPSAPAFGKPSTPAFGQPSQPAFGAPGVPGMGAASALGNKVSPWGQPATQSNIATPPKGQVFGSALGGASGNATFGSSSGLGNKAPVWATSSPGSQPAFGKPSEPSASGFAKFNTPAKDENKSPTSPFAAIGNKDQSKPHASPFAAFAPSASATNKPSPLSFGFGKPSTAAAPPEKPAEENKEESMEDESQEKPQDEPAKEKPSNNAAEAPKPTTIFGQPSEKPQPSVLGQTSDKPATSSPFASTPDKSKASTLFGQSTDSPKSPASVFGLPAKQTGFQFGKPSGKPASPLSRDSDKASKLPTLGGFKLGSTFQGDGSAKDDLPAPKQGGGSLFGAGFSNMLGEASKETKAGTPIKKEPGTEASKLDDIPSQQEEPEDAPLPPDFTSSKPKQSVEEDVPPIAGSPPVDLGGEAGQLPASDDEEEDDDEDEDGSWIQDDGEEYDGDDGDEQEGEEEDEDEYDEEDEEDDDESEAEEPENTFDMEKASKTPFGSRLEFPSLSHSTGDASKLLRPTSPAASTTPAGLPKGPFFAPPSKSQDSPRSPSPIRQTSSTPAGHPASRQPITVPSLKKAPSFKNSKSSSAQRPESPQVPDAGELSDEEDVRVRELLASEVEPSMDLEPFIAHQDYVGRVNKLGIAGQIEKVYRDINSMIDTLGLNARSLESFIKGHETQYKQAGRDRSDLEEAEEWCLVEVNELDVVQKEIGEDLDAGKVDGVSQKLEELAELQKNATRLRTRTVDMRKQIGAHADPQQRATHRASPLTNDAQIQQNELREGVAKVQKLLQDAEEALSVLRADLAAAPSQGSAAQRVPTVEAVTNTIMKMTAMIEQKSGDVDVLEAQIRRLPGGIANLNISDSNEDLLRSSVRSVRPLERSTSGNLFGTPPATRGKYAATNGAAPLGISGMLGRFGGSLRRDNGDAEFGRSSLMLEGTPRRKMADVSVEEVRRYQDRAAQRKRVLAALKQTVEKKGTRVTGTGKN